MSHILNSLTSGFWPVLCVLTVSIERFRGSQRDGVQAGLLPPCLVCVPFPLQLLAAWLCPLLYVYLPSIRGSAGPLAQCVLESVSATHSTRLPRPSCTDVGPSLFPPPYPLPSSLLSSLSS